MLEVVQYQQDALVPDELGDSFDRFFSDYAIDTKRASNRRADQISISDGNKASEGDSAREPIGKRRGGCEGKPGFPDAAGSSQGQQRDTLVE
jgi:hypothetical protein